MNPPGNLWSNAEPKNWWTLDDFEKKVWALNVEGWSQKEIVRKLKEDNIHKDQPVISRKLKIINDKFTKFIESGEL